MDSCSFLEPSSTAQMCDADDVAVFLISHWVRKEETSRSPVERMAKPKMMLWAVIGHPSLAGKVVVKGVMVVAAVMLRVPFHQERILPKPELTLVPMPLPSLCRGDSVPYQQSAEIARQRAFVGAAVGEEQQLRYPGERTNPDTNELHMSISQTGRFSCSSSWLVKVRSSFSR